MIPLDGIGMESPLSTQMDYTLSVPYESDKTSYGIRKASYTAMCNRMTVELTSP